MAGTVTALSALIAAAAFTGMSPSSPAFAEAPKQVRSQVPGYFRMALGDFEITALYDGFLKVDPKLLSGVPAKDVQTLLARMFLPSTGATQTAVNAYLLNSGTNLILIDTGAAKAFGPETGVILENLRAAGYDPAQVDTVLLTHLHPDHTMGLLMPDGKPAFPNATVRAARADSDYWLRQAIAAAAPKEAQIHFQMARNAVAPYVAAGRFKPFEFGEQIVPGLQAIEAAGHTPGHTAYSVRSNDQRLLIWGDIVHSHAVQFARPDVVIEFDVKKDQALATRRRLFADAAREKLFVAGAHLPFPGIGHVRAETEGYSWVPLEYGPVTPD